MPVFKCLSTITGSLFFAAIVWIVFGGPAVVPTQAERAALIAGVNW